MHFFKIFTDVIFLSFVTFDLYVVVKAENDVAAVVNAAQPMTCYSCEGVSCLRISKLNATTECTDSLDYCVTVFKGFTVVARGCFTTLPTNLREKCVLDSHPECTKCVGNRCNDKGREDFKCIECTSSHNNKCATEAGTIASTQCPIPTSQNSYCYVRQSADGTMTRGCMVHQREQRECLHDAHCSMCVSDFSEACNSYKLATQITSGVDSLLRNDKVNRVIGGVVFVLITLCRHHQ